MIWFLQVTKVGDLNYSLFAKELKVVQMPISREKFILFFLVLLIPCFQYAQTSVSSLPFSEGDWYKFKTVAFGVHKLSYEHFLQIGLIPEDINPLSLKIYGGEAGLLPQTNTIPSSGKVIEYAIEIVGGSDGSFDPEDYVLFYIPSADKRLANMEKKQMEVEFNIYDRYSYCFLTIDQDNESKRVVELDVQANTPVGEIYYYNDYFFHKKVNKNLLTSGRQWVGEKMAEGDAVNVSLPIDNIATLANAHLEARVLSTSKQNSRFTFNLSGNEIGEIPINRLPFFVFGKQAETASGEFDIAGQLFSQDANSLQISFSDLTGDAGYLDYFQLNYERKLVFTDSQFGFRSFASLGFPTSRFHIENMKKSYKVWKVTNEDTPEAVSVDVEGDEGTFICNTSELEEFVVFNPNQLPAPTFVKKINTQPLSTFPTPELLIISPAAFLNEAQRLADFRQSNDNIQSAVVDVEAIYNEFGAGRKDISAIRNFVRHLYQQSDRLRYLLLFGDASYDYLSSHSDTTNRIPTYQSRNSFHNVYTYASDDYFAFLEDDEGEWEESNLISMSPHDLDIGVGRLPVKTNEDARIIVDKLIAYGRGEETDLGWRNRLLFLADDGENNKFQAQSDYLASFVEEANPEYLVDRVFVDAFPITSSQGRKSAPQVRSLINQYINEGVLVLDFIGHGGETALTNEGILDLESIAEWQNGHRLPLIITATCEFGRHDDWEIESGAEKALFKENGGAIGLLTTSRPSVVNTNFDISRAFYENAFDFGDQNRPRLGDIFRSTKNQGVFGVINRNFVLLGDPSMQLAYPKYEVVVNAINEGNVPEQLEAFTKIKLTGEIREKQNLVGQFNGKLDICFFDEKTNLTTLGNGANRAMAYENWQDLLVKGAVTVESGRFQAEFSIPGTGGKSIKEGKLLFYAYEPNSGRDAAGSYSGIKILDNDVESNDQNGPEIALSIDHEDFENGDLVSETITLHASFEDESGINLNADPEQAIVMYLDDDIDNKVVLTQFYTSNIDDFNSGQLRYLVADLTVGPHKLTVEASDNFNNRTRTSINFTVSDSDVTLLQQLKTFPNPAKDVVNFEFYYKNAPEELKAILLIYSSQGELLRAVEKSYLDHATGNQKITWNLTNSNGRLVKPGLYFYDFYLVSILNNQANKKGKILIQR